LPTSVTKKEPDAVTGWTGFVIFGGCIMILVGSFNMVQGLVGIFDNDFYARTDSAIISLNYTGWGWYLLIMGALLVFTGFGVMVGQFWARLVAVILLMINAISHLFFMPAYPLWSLVVIALDVLVIYSIVAHGREMLMQ
jgi:hypothetical protein